MDGVAVASPVGLPEKVTMLVIWDGSAYRPVSAALPVADGKVLVLLHETDGAKPAIPAYDFLNTGIMPQTGDLMVRSGDWMRSRVNRAVYDAALITWNGKEAMLLTLSGDTVIGSPVVTTDGKLAGIIMAEYAEGETVKRAFVKGRHRECRPDFFRKERVMRTGQKHRINFGILGQKLVHILFHKEAGAFSSPFAVFHQRHPHRAGMLGHLEFREKVANFQNIAIR